jgi:hypothetical protein
VLPDPIGEADNLGAAAGNRGRQRHTRLAKRQPDFRRVTQPNPGHQVIADFFPTGDLGSPGAFRCPGAGCGL